MKKNQIWLKISKKLKISNFKIILSFFKIFITFILKWKWNYNEIQNLIEFFVNSLPIKLINEHDNYLNIIKKLNEEILNS
jgi:hypothetical protein